VILGLRHYYNRDYSRAINTFRKTLAISPYFSPAYWMMALPLAAAGEIQEAIKVSETCNRLSPDINSISLAILGITYALSPKHQKDAYQVIDTLNEVSKNKRISAFFVGMIYTCLKDKEQAFQWFERAEQEQDSMLMWIKADPIVNHRLCDDPRYIALTRKLGLEK
jgi:tetratricopeptide (TPR) repeat protein